MMNTIYKYIATLFVLIVVFSSCAEDNLMENDLNKVKEGIPVELTLSYQALMSKEIVTRATIDEEKQLKDLQIFVFSADNDGDDSNNYLKGYKKITSGLVQNTSNGQSITGSFTIKTTTGAVLIYGIANATTTIYSVNEIAGADWTEEKAQAKEYKLTLADFKQKSFARNVTDETNPSDGYFVMSGVMNSGNSFTITETANKDNDGNIIGGTTGLTDNVLRLKRIVSKVNFNFTAATNKTFTLTKYDICNIPQTGRIIETTDATDGTTNNIEGIIPSTQTPNKINVYLPENLQYIVEGTTIISQKERETNSYSAGSKSFDNAPINSTYIVAYGRYSDEDKKTAEVEYTIHLGDFSIDFTNFLNERNCEYTYNITVKGVDEIIAEAKKEDDEDQSDYNPGVEGFVLNPITGQVFTMDSHYGSCVMSFTYEDIQKLVTPDANDTDKGFVFQIQDWSGRSSIYMVKDKVYSSDEQTSWEIANFAECDLSWIEFAKHNASDGTTNPITYTYSKGKGVNEGDKLYSVPELLNYLYVNRNNQDVWPMTFTCFIEENYYEEKSWDTYTNIEPRKLYIANDIAVSSDDHSIYAEVKYAVEQYAIQTFYNREKANDIIAYGCETIDETETSDNRYSLKPGAEVGTFDGRETMVSKVASFNWNDDIYPSRTTWEDNAWKNCMKRNRDLNRNGTIDNDEIRWYLPTYAQYNGFWLGEEALGNTNARLYTKQTSDIIDSDGSTKMHYYTATSGRETFWSEECSSFSNSIDAANGSRFIRCIRNLESEGTALDDTDVLAKYYQYEDKVFDLSNMDSKALRMYSQYVELGNHTERDPLNKVRSKFRVASSNLQNDEITLQKVVEGDIKCEEGAYSETSYTNGWRVPNQRELSLLVLENANGYTLTPNGTQHTEDEKGTYCRTKFSNIGYRYSFGWGAWGNNQAPNSRMYQNTDKYLNQGGFVRCVRDEEN